MNDVRQARLVYQMVSQFADRYDTLAQAAYPSGGHLACRLCPAREPFDLADLQAWFREGWPQCCGRPQQLRAGRPRGGTR